MLSTDTTKIFSIQLKSDYRFINQATCIIGAQMEGNYQVQKFGYERILILKKENIKPDTLRLSIVADKLTLTEIYNGYAWSHYFNKN